ncbi:GNAT family acetyltransferase [Paenibacillus sp. LC231]|uniref:GNAT family N-acetyltransferase n=1 Tax=unclassified Paenibacillus TaxID=185978 RepID=UPI0008DCB59E|nr:MULTISPECIES: GNAT family N-acetyltransferase [unclassified Paenibacillus]MCT1399049.1 GNAT family N-acetyltransferase [Paenibacillus sp. p3-SID867]OIB04379.1 GNAT family acetyltransferase [Paenibacillus sp. LC231]
MLQVEVRRPNRGDIKAIEHFFRLVITDTFAKEGLADLLEDIEQEIDSKNRYLNADFETNGEQRYFLIGLLDNSIVSCIEYGPSTALIREATDGKLRDVVEIGTVFVHPDCQQQGIGNLMLNIMYLTLLNKGLTEFCLDSGYSRAQKIWKKKLGEPDYVLQDHWGSGADHMIWKRRLADVPVIFSL